MNQETKEQLERLLSEIQTISNRIIWMANSHSDTEHFSFPAEEINAITQKAKNIVSDKAV